jgi:hypothetical protein
VNAATRLRFLGWRVIQDGFVDGSLGVLERLVSAMLGPGIVNQSVYRNKGSALRKGIECFAYEHILSLQIPVMQSVAHDDDIRSRKIVLKEASLDEMRCVSPAESICL